MPCCASSKCFEAEGKNKCTPSQRAPGSRAVRDPRHVRKHLVREPGDSTFVKVGKPGELRPPRVPALEDKIVRLSGSEQEVVSNHDSYSDLTDVRERVACHMHAPVALYLPAYLAASTHLRHVLGPERSTFIVRRMYHHTQQPLPWPH